MVKYSMEHSFGALASRARLLLIEQLRAGGRMPVSALARPLQMSLPGVLKHLRVLESAGIVRRRKEGRVSYCSLNTRAFNDELGWLLAHKHFWDHSFSRLGARVRASPHGGARQRKNKN